MGNKKDDDRPSRSETIQGNNDRERLLFIGHTFSGLNDIPESQIATRSADGETVITIQGTKVTEALVEAAMREEKARAAAARAAAGVPADAVSKNEVKAMIDEAVRNALAVNPPKA